MGILPYFPPFLQRQITTQVHVPVVQMRMGKRDNLGMIFHITPSKLMLGPIIRTVLLRQF